jgi:hypothetical protein
MLGQTAELTVELLEDLPPSTSLLIGPMFDLAQALPAETRAATSAAEVYKLFYVFEAYLRSLMLDVLTKDGGGGWWSKVPKDVQDEVLKVEETEEVKAWMALASRDRSALMTYPQLLRIIEHNWKTDFEDVVRDRSLIHEARVVGHIRNTIAHMSDVSDEEKDRVRQTIRDWFRRVAP